MIRQTYLDTVLIITREISMPFTIITLRKSTPSLRGDLSKWMQEIATGVYIGNFNSRVRELLWKRVTENVGDGEATISYTAQNELGYNFQTFNTKRIKIDSDGIPLISFPKTQGSDNTNEGHLGFSNASKYRESRKISRKSKSECAQKTGYIVLDIETGGLDETKDSILEIGAVRITSDKIDEFQKLIRQDYRLSKSIVELTGITDDLLIEEGADLSRSLEEFVEFAQGQIIVGYNINFDMKFINSALHKVGQPVSENMTIDLLPLVKKEKMYLSNYKLETALEAFGINEKVKHRALEDAKQTYRLSKKLKKFEDLLNQKC